jgi:regulator of sigma E protease
VTGVLEQLGLFILVLGPIVFIHETGHFLFAKLLGVRVEVFSLGFGPRLLGLRRGDTDYRLSLVPLGGYVKMTGEMGGEQSEADDPEAFSSKPRWARFLVMVAGALFNILLAILLWTGLTMNGIYLPVEEEGPPVVGVVAPGGPAERAGLRPGDQILAIGGEAVEEARTFLRAELLNPGATLDVEILRDGQHRSLPLEIEIDTSVPQHVGRAGLYLRQPFQVIQVEADSAADQAGFRAGDQFVAVDGEAVDSQQHLIDLIQGSEGGELSFTMVRGGETRALRATPVLHEDGQWRIGVVFGPATEFVRLGPLRSMRHAAGMAWEHAGDLLYTLRQLVTARIGFRVLSGPLEIASYIKQTAEMGLAPLIHFMAWISLQLGIINLLPIPVLDGGHILVLSVEGVSRRDLSLKLKERIMIAGLIFLVAVMATVIGMDILKIIEGSGG